MENHLSNLKNHCRYCARKIGKKHLLTIKKNEILWRSGLLTKILADNTIHPKPKEKFCRECKNMIISNITSVGGKEPYQTIMVEELRRGIHVFKQHFPTPLCEICDYELIQASSSSAAAASSTAASAAAASAAARSTSATIASASASSGSASSSAATPSASTSAGRPSASIFSSTPSASLATPHAGSDTPSAPPAFELIPSTGPPPYEPQQSPIYDNVFHEPVDSPPPLPPWRGSSLGSHANIEASGSSEGNSNLYPNLEVDSDENTEFNLAVDMNLNQTPPEDSDSESDYVDTPTKYTKGQNRKISK